MKTAAEWNILSNFIKTTKNGFIAFMCYLKIIHDTTASIYTLKIVINKYFQLCQQICHQAAVSSDCSCYWPELFIPSLSDDTEAQRMFTFDKRPCDISLSDNPDRTCYDDIIRQFDTRNR